MSDETTNAADRLDHSLVPLLRPDDLTVADNWDDLIAGGPDSTNKIVIDELGATNPGHVWTGTANDGTFYAGPPAGTATDSCNGWANGTSGSG